MNADDRTNSPGANTFTPVNDPAAQPASGSVPTTGNVARRSAMPATRSSQYATTPATAPTRQAAPTYQPVTGEQPLSGTHPTTAPEQSAGASAFSAGAAGAASAVGAGMGKLKGYATKAKDSLTEGDDITAARGKGGPRKARVLLSRIDPWSALKMGFLLSIALGIMLVVAVFVLWSALNNQGVFTMANDWIQKLFTTTEFDLLQFTSLKKVMSATILLSIVNVVLLTALATIGAFLYNIVSSVVGGVYVTLTDD